MTVSNNIILLNVYCFVVITANKELVYWLKSHGMSLTQTACNLLCGSINVLHALGLGAPLCHAGCGL